jgi:hypothetical protein
MPRNAIIVSPVSLPFLKQKHAHTKDYNGSERDNGSAVSRQRAAHAG